MWVQMAIDRANRRRGPIGAGLLAVLAAGGLAACHGVNPRFEGIDAGARAGGTGGGGAPGGAGGGGGVAVGGAGAASGGTAGGAGAASGGTTGGAGAASGGTAGGAGGGTSLDAAGPTLDASPVAEAAADAVVLPGPDAAPDAASLADGPAAGGDLPVDTVAPTALYNFEQSTQGWGDLRPGGVTPPVVSRTSALSYDGRSALAVSLRSNASASSTHSIVGVYEEFRSRLPAGTTIHFRLWVPAGSAFDYIQPYVLYYKPSDPDGDPRWGGIDPPLFPADLPRDTWIPITHRVPLDADARGVVEVGFEFVLLPSRSVTVYIDAVTW
jgi:hypothetical protein